MALQLHLVILVLLAALLHASWNAVIGTLVLKEPFGRVRVAAAAVIVVGVVLMQWAG